MVRFLRTLDKEFNLWSAFTTIGSFLTETLDLSLYWLLMMQCVLTWPSTNLYRKGVVFFDPVEDKFLLIQLGGNVELMASPLVTIRV
jgi:hypothetical protein